MSQVCRTCLEVISNSTQLFSLENKEPALLGAINIKTKLQACVPEMALHRIRNSVICRYCLYALNMAYDFKTKCLQTETKLFELVGAEGQVIDGTDLNRFVMMRNNCYNNTYYCGTMGQNGGAPRLLPPPPPMPPPPPPPITFRAPPPPTTYILPSFNHASYKCPVCQQCFVSDSILREHMTCHNTFPTNSHNVNSIFPTPYPPRNNTFIIGNGSYNITPSYKCNVCQQCFGSNEMLKEHMHQHVTSLNLHCNMCDFRTNLPAYLDEHLKCHSVAPSNSNIFVQPQQDYNAPSYKCSVCYQCFSSNEQLKQHMSCHETHKCTQCSYYTNSEASLKEHVKTHLNEAPTSVLQSVLESVVCNTAIEEQVNHTNSTEPPVENHSVPKSTPEPKTGPTTSSLHQCGLCNFRSSHSSSLRRHMKVHMGDRPFRCPECRFGAPNEATLAVHIEVHKKNQPQKCSECDFIAPTKNALKNHMMWKHEKKTELIKTSALPDPYQITMNDIQSVLEDDDCSSDLPTNLTDEIEDDIPDSESYIVTLADIQHILAGQPDENDMYPCTVCGRQLKHLYLLRRHMRKYHGISSSKRINRTVYQCTRCNFRSKVKSHWQVHMKTHTGGKYYSCKQCDYSTVYWSNMDKHKKVHQGQELSECFECPLCGYRAAKQISLMAHMSVHADEGEYKCTQCSFTTASKTGLLDHLETHSAGSFGRHFIDSFSEDIPNEQVNGVEATETANNTQDASNPPLSDKENNEDVNGSISDAELANVASSADIADIPDNEISAIIETMSVMSNNDASMGHDLEFEPEPEPEPESELGLEPEPESELGLEAEPEIGLDPELEPEHMLESEHELESQDLHEHDSEPVSELDFEPEPELPFEPKLELDTNILTT